MRRIGLPGQRDLRVVAQGWQRYVCRSCRRQRVPLMATMPSRHLSWTSAKRSKDEDKDRFDWTTGTTGLHHIARDVTEAYEAAPLVTSRELALCKEPASDVKMLFRDFVDDSLYNPYYGYFNWHAEIFTPPQPIKMRDLVDNFAFHDTLAEMYDEFENTLDTRVQDSSRQVWHTPTEIFQPYYGEAIAHYMVSEYKLTGYPYHDLIIYEIGGGNGTLMRNVMDYIAREEPDIYEYTQYRIIEVAPTLAERQQRLVAASEPYQHSARVQIINQSILDWEHTERSPCFVVALEVFDNLAHDIVRYDYVTEEPRQGLVYIDKQGDFHEILSPTLDGLTSRFLDMRRNFFDAAEYRHFRTPKFVRKMLGSLPLMPNMSQPEYVPTQLLRLFDVLQERFPQHRLVAADFSSLPKAVPGFNSPVVQTRYQRTMIPCGTPLVARGYFDYLFPTDWKFLTALYDSKRNFTRAWSIRDVKCMSHQEFLKVWGNTEATRTRSGENPMLEWYGNMNFFLT